MLDTSVIVQYSMDPTTWGEVIHEDVHTHRGAIISCAIITVKRICLKGSLAMHAILSKMHRHLEQSCGQLKSMWNLYQLWQPISWFDGPSIPLEVELLDRNVSITLNFILDVTSLC